ncbi:RICIN domain-containing protein [Kitasatospora purpeofusca]|uniref:RICIN domain-containing protein n=1 Tax=Kitasatospora purpeofusca TaxID=67352 RepID=UPI00365A9E25
MCTRAAAAAVAVLVPLFATVQPAAADPLPGGVFQMKTRADYGGQCATIEDRLVSRPCNKANRAQQWTYNTEERVLRSKDPALAGKCLTVVGPWLAMKECDPGPVFGDSAQKFRVESGALYYGEGSSWVEPGRPGRRWIPVFPDGPNPTPEPDYSHKITFVPVS